MNVLLFGATGMIGGGVLTECLEDAGVGSVVCVGRSPTGRTHPKLRDLVVPDLVELEAHADELGPFDACLYALGVSSAGMGEEAYRRVTVDLTVAVMDVLERLEPEMTLCFVSGQGSGRESPMWSRVKGEAEEAVLSRDFPGYVFRPGIIRPVKGARSGTALYRVLYAVLGPLFPLVARIAPDAVTDTATVARSMIRVARRGHPTPILEMPDINRTGAGES